MANCIYCDKPVRDDETAGMTKDGTFKLYHPGCRPMIQMDLFHPTRSIEGRKAFLRWAKFHRC